MKLPSPKLLTVVMADAERAGVDPGAWAAVEIAMGEQWKGRGIPTPRDTTEEVFKALKAAGFSIVRDGD